MDNKQQKFLNQFRCSTHINNKIMFINVSNDQQVSLMCDQCLIDNKISIDVLSIQTIRKCDDQYIFSNWPPLNDSRILKDIQQDSQINICDYINKIEDIYDKMKDFIIRKIDESKKNTIIQIQSDFMDKKGFIEKYNEVSGIQKLKEIVVSKHDTIDILDEEIKEFVKLKYEQKDENTNILQQYQAKINECRSKFYKVNENILEYITQILDELNNISLKNQQNSDINILNYNSLSKLQNDLIQKFNEDVKSYRDIIPELIGKVKIVEYKKSNQINLIQSFQNICLSIQRDSKEVNRIYIDYGLKKEKKYVIKLKFSQPVGDYLKIGISNKSDNNQKLNQEIYGKAFEDKYKFNNNEYHSRYNSNNNYVNSEYEQVINGYSFNNTEQKDQIIEMRIDLSRSSQPNIIEYKHGHQFDVDKIYFLQFYFEGKKKYTFNIDIVEFKEVLKF